MPFLFKKQTKVGTSSISRARHGNFMKQPRIFPNTSCWTQPQTWRYTPKSSLYRWIVHYQLTIHFNRIFPYKPSILIGCSWIFPQKPSIFGVSPLKKNTVRWVVPAGPMYISGRFSTCSRCCKSWYLWKTTSRHESFQRVFFLGKSTN